MIRSIISFFILLSLSTVTIAGEWSGYAGTEFRWFSQHSLDPIQDHSTDISFSSNIDYYHEWDDGDQSLLISPFLRLDQRDSERSHFDLREFSWMKVANDWELRIGLRQVFWGVAESAHLVDIINQTDLIENIDTEDKLGQPMINVALIKDWGTVDFFILPGFRERTFPGREGRLRSQPRVDTDNPVYESSAEDAHIDFAIRWSHVIGDFDIGLSHFYGTSRAPRLEFGLNGSEPVLIPHYDIINQTGLDLQATISDWLWKLEVIYVSGQPSQSRDEHYFSAVGGLEYTFVGAFESNIDIGIVSEYLFDDRDTNAQTPFEDDLFIGVRLAFNDVQSTDLLAGIIFDRKSSAKSFNLEASRRLGDSLKVDLEARFFSDIPEDDFQFTFRNEDYVQLQINQYF